MKRYLDYVNPARWIRSAWTVRRVHSDREFASILNRERNHADRTGQEFSMVVFEVGANNGKSGSVDHLVPILTHRIRSTDAIGWLEDGRIGVILPQTMPEGAWTFVANLRLAENGSLPPPDCHVYVYPSGWIPSVNRGPVHTPPAGPAIFDQVEDEKGHSHARSRTKGLSISKKIIIPVGVVILAFLILDMLHK